MQQTWLETEPVHQQLHVLAPYQTNQKLHSKRSKTNFTSNRGGRWNGTDNIWQKQQQLLSPLSEHFNKTVTCSHHTTTIVSMTNYHWQWNGCTKTPETWLHQKRILIKFLEGKIRLPLTLDVTTALDRPQAGTSAKHYKLPKLYKPHNQFKL